MKIGIIGPGAIGCLFAGFLSRAGQDVWLLDHRKERAKALSSEYINIEDIGGLKQVKVHSTSDPSKIKDLELVILAVKSYSTEQAIRYWLPCLDSAFVLTLQNGIGNAESMSRFIKKESLLAGTTSEGSTFLKNGCIRYAGKGETIFGYFYKQTGSAAGERIKKILNVIKSAGFDAKITGRVSDTLWTKLAINTGINALTAILKVSNGKLLESEYSSDIMDTAVQETVCVGDKIGIKFLYPDMTEKTQDTAKLTSQNRSSMLQDILAKRKTEIDAINGAVVQNAVSFNLPTPVNKFLWMTVKALEQMTEYSTTP